MLYRKAHKLLEEIKESTIDGTRKEHMELLATVKPLEPQSKANDEDTLDEIKIFHWADSCL